MNKMFRLLALVLSGLLSAADLLAGTPGPAADTGGAPPVVVTPGAGAAAVEDDAPEIAFPAPKAGTVSARTLNVRAGPSVDKALIASLKQGQPLSVLASKGKWLKVELPPEVSLWIMSKYVTLPQGQPLPALGVVNSAQVRLRAGGDVKSAVLRNLDQDAQLEVVSASGDWLKVKAPPGTAGWVYASYVKLGDTGLAAAGPDVGKTNPVAGGTRVTPPVADPGIGDGTAAEQPVAAEPVEPPPVLTGPGVEVFAGAEAAYREALASATPDFTPVFLLYRKAALTEGVPDAVKNTCEARMQEMAGKMPEEQKKRVEAEVRRGIEEQVAALRAAAEEAKRQLPRVAPRPTAVGFLDPAPALPGIPGTHKLSESGVLLYYLRSTADDVDLARFVGHKVGVVGRKVFAPGWGIQVIEVIDIFDYKEPPSTSATLEKVD
jgi:SH3-like domain-containing protein